MRRIRLPPDVKMRKMGYFQSEEELFRILKMKPAFWGRSPLTFILEAADDIAYRTADIEMHLKVSLITGLFWKN